MANNSLFQRLKKRDYALQTVISAGFSMMLTALFALYNGYLGLSLSSVWHGSISVFYLILVAIRGTILLTERKNRRRSEPRRSFYRRRAYLGSCVLLLILDLALIAPISMMVVMQKPVDLGLIPAITMAAYTTYKVTMASVHLRRQTSRSGGNVLISELRAINFIDALVSVLTLQNTLIMVNQTPSDTKSMLLLTAISSAVIYAAIVLLSVALLIQGLRKNKTTTDA